MKKSIIVFTFAMLLAVNTNAKATQIGSLMTKNDSSEFAFYLEKQVPLFYQLNTQHWKTFQKVVTMFNGSTSNLMKVSNEERISFIISSEELKRELAITKNRGSEKWINAISQTEAIIKFTWSLQQPIEVEFEKVPATKKLTSLDTNFLGK